MILVVGYGNPLRCDDRLGFYVVERLERQHIPAVETRLYQQLHLEILEEILSFDKIILVDAKEEGEDVTLEKVDPSSGKRLISSHHLNPSVLSELAKTLYKTDLNLYLCSIRGENFGLGEDLSVPALARADKAVEMILPLLQKG